MERMQRRWLCSLVVAAVRSLCVTGCTTKKLETDRHLHHYVHGDVEHHAPRGRSSRRARHQFERVELDHDEHTSRMCGVSTQRSTEVRTVCE